MPPLLLTQIAAGVKLRARLVSLLLIITPVGSSEAIKNSFKQQSAVIHKRGFLSYHRKKIVEEFRSIDLFLYFPQQRTGGYGREGLDKVPLHSSS